MGWFEQNVVLFLVIVGIVGGVAGWIGAKLALRRVIATLDRVSRD